jgi:hypothetical protein
VADAGCYGNADGRAQCRWAELTPVACPSETLSDTTETGAGRTRVGGRAVKEGMPAGGEAAMIDPLTQPGRVGESVESPPEPGSKPWELRSRDGRAMPPFPGQLWHDGPAGSAKQGR